jgi:hypothetical protein
MKSATNKEISMRFHSAQAAEDFGFDIVTSFDDGMYGSRTVVYRWKRTGWVTTTNDESVYRSDDMYVGSAYSNSNGTIYTLDPKDDPTLRKVIKGYRAAAI